MKTAKILVMGLGLSMIFACGSKNGNTVPSPKSAGAPAITSGEKPQSPLRKRTSHRVSTARKSEPQLKTAAVKEEEVGAIPVGTHVAEILQPAPAEPAPVQKVEEPQVIGLGSVSQSPKDFLSRGYGWAMNDAISCRVRGVFINGSQCYAVFSDGSSSYVTASNRDLIIPYVAGLQQEADAVKAENQERKLAKKEAKLKAELAKVQEKMRQNQKQNPVQQAANN